MSAIFGESIILPQESGPEVELVVDGDEYYARHENQEGYTVVYDNDLGLYSYAGLVDGYFVSTGVPLTKLPPPGTARHLQESAEVQSAKFERRFARLRPEETPAAGDGRLRTFAPNNGLLNGRRVSEGAIEGLTVLVEFQDVRSDISSGDVDALLNDDDYHANGNFSSVREYFRTVSNGKLDYSNRVVGPVRLSRNRRFYETTLFVEEALNIVVNDLGVNLADFDSRGDGIVDAVNFMYAGRTIYGIAGDDNNPSELWPHNSTINLQFGAVRTHFYMLTSLGRRRVDLSIGTFCHESAHLLCRFPDLYDYGRRDGDLVKSRGIGKYCLMGSGNHLDRGRTPSPVSAYLRHLVDWADVILINDPGEYEARHGDYGKVLKFETDKANEFFMIENRTRLGLDAHQLSSGLAGYHCDKNGSNEWQGGTPSRHYQCALIQADGRLDLEGNRPSDATDLFGEIAGVALSHATDPASREWDGSDSGLIVSDIGAPGPTIRFRTGPQALPTQVTGRVTADLLIPDNDPAGVTSLIQVDRSGRITGLSVDVDIIHTWKSDLRVTLEGPGGQTAVLHNRTGGSQDDLKETWSSADFAALQVFTGLDVEGPWRLHIADLEGRDTGRLNEWGLEIEIEIAERVVRGEASPNLAIPDFDAQGVTSSIEMAEQGTLKEITADVQISHTFIRDLQVELVAPSGQSALLHDRSGGGANDIRRSYATSTTPALQALADTGIQGTWRLRLRDLEGADVGTLETWSLEITYT